MPANANVFIEYGPYRACGVVDHRTSRLDGLQNVLTLHGHKSTLKQTKNWNEVELWVNGELVFKCDIRELDYGGDGLLDPLCKEALLKVTHGF